MKCICCKVETNDEYKYHGFCMIKIADAAIADGYTVADGQVWKPNPDYCDCGADACFNASNEKLVKAGGGGT